MEIVTNSANETKKAGQTLAEELLKEDSKDKAVIIALEGNLGSGKTTFIQGMAKGLGIEDPITSPTFVIFKKYNIAKLGSLKWLYHADCYRLDSYKDILDLGFEEIFNNPKNLIVIEWAERIKKGLSKTSLWIKFKYIDEKKRKINLYEK